MQHDSCYTPQCPRRETCSLWRNALDAIEAGQALVSVTNPRLIEQAGGYDHCPLYYEYKLRRYARGLVWRYRQMSIGQLDALHEALTKHFGYSNLVRIRCGYEVLSPEEQGQIAAIFARVAPGHEPEYKRFEEHYTKPPRIEGRAVHELGK